MASSTFTRQLETKLLPVIALITIAVYLPLLWHDFVNYDDYSFVVANPNVQSGITLETLRWAFTAGYDANWIPLTWLSHMLDVQVFGLNPAGHHFTNLLLHVANTALLFIFCQRTTRRPWRSAMVALLFALHPLHVESVAWVAERKDVLSTFFWMLTLYAYTLYAEKPGPARYGAALVLFALGLLTKPMLVTMPLILLLLDYWPLGRITAGRSGTSNCRTFAVPGLSRLIAEKIPFLLLSVAASFITYFVQQANRSISSSYTLPARIAKAAVNYIEYLGKMVWPAKLAVIYPFDKYGSTLGTVAGCAALLLLVTAAVIWLRTSQPYLLTGWFWYIITLLPVIGIVQIGSHSVADRYTYIPLTGIFLMLVWAAAEISEKRRTPRVVATTSALILITMIALTSLQLSHWQSSATLFTHALNVTENNWIAHNNLGTYLQDQGQVDTAISHFLTASKAKPSFVPAYLNLGYAYRLKGDLQQSVNSYKKALQFEPVNTTAHHALGLLHLELGNRELALQEYYSLQKTDPEIAAILLQEINSQKP